MTEGLEANLKKYHEQLAQDPKSRVFVPLSDLYRQSGRYDEAIYVAKEGLKHHPNYLSGKIALARAHFENGESESAYDLLDGVLATSPDNLLANRIFAEIALQLDRKEEAKAALLRILTIEPSDARTKKMLSGLESKEEAVSPPAAVPPPGVQSPTLAELYRSQGHPKEAAAVLDQIAKRETEKPDLPKVSKTFGKEQILNGLLNRILERRRMA